MDREVGDSSNGDGFDDGIVVNIIGGYDAICNDGERIVDFGDEKDVDDDGCSIGDGSVATSDGIDPDFGVDKTISLQGR